MVLLERIRARYGGLIETQEPVTSAALREAEFQMGVPVPAGLAELLMVTNGVGELADVHGSRMRISQVVYTLEEMVKWTVFYRTTYQQKGVVFADNGAGDLYFLMEDGSVQEYGPITQETEQVADSLEGFF